MQPSGFAAKATYAAAIATVFGFVAAMAVIPAMGAEPWAARQSAIPATAVPTLTSTWPGGERRLPLVLPGGRIERVFPDGVPSLNQFEPDPPEVTQLLRDLVSDAGLEAIREGLITRDRRPYVRDPNDEAGASYLWSYPYSYPAVDGLIASGVDLPLRTAREKELVELSSGLLFTGNAPAAFSLLQRLKSLGNSCEIQVNLAQTVALGYRPDRAIVDREFAEAEQLCSDDPIAFVAHSRVALAFDTRGDEIDILFKPGELGQEDKAMALAREAQRRFPAHVGGYLAEAVIQLEVASEYAVLNRHPFTNRAMFQRSLDLLTAVSAVQGDDPSVRFAIARSRAGLGDATAAMGTGSPALTSFASGPEAHKASSALYGWALDAGDPAQALDFEATADRAKRQRTLCRSLNQDAFNGALATAGTPEPGWRGTCNVQLVDATGGEFAGGADIFSYESYIPRYRNKAPSSQVLRVLAGQPAAPLQPNERNVGPLLEAALTGNWTGAEAEVEDFQDAFRRIGRFDRAEALLMSALKANAADPLTLYDRLGEVRYLQGKFAEAADAFRLAVERDTGDAPERPEWDQTDTTSLSVAWAGIKQATALSKTGRDDEALRVLSTLVLDTADTSWRPGLQQLARFTLVGIIEMRSSRFSESAAAFETALASCEEWTDSQLSPCLAGAQENNLAIGLMKAGRAESAVELAQRAIDRDPKNPMFVEGLANALETKGDPDGAARVYRAAIERDPTQFTAQNNLGVILARQGDLEEAVERFRAAVAGNPSYPAGWFNLGLAWAASGDLGAAVRSQGALGRAAKLDPAFREADPDWVSDTTVYDPGLDLSKPIPKDWSAGTNRKPLPVAFGLPLLLASVLHVVRALVSDNVYGRITEWALGWTRRRPFASMTLPRWGELAAIIVCGVILGAGMGAAQGWNPWLTAAGSIAALLTVLSYVAARKLLDHRVTHRGSTGGTLVGVLGAPFGVSFAPVPVVEAAVRPTVRWAPLAVTSLLAITAMALTFATGVPLVRAVAQVAVLVVGSSLIPIEPFEGTKVPRSLSLPLAILLALPTLAFSAQWL